MPGPVDDTWTLSNGSPWSSAIWTTIRNVRGSSAAPAVLSGAGRMGTGSPPENCRIIAAPADTFTDLNLTVAMKTTVANTIEIGFRVSTNIASGADPTDGYILSIRTTDGILRFNTINAYDNLAQTFETPHDDGQWRIYRILSRGTRHRARWWLATDPEPSIWKLDITHSAYPSGRCFLGVWNNDDNVTSAVVDFDDFHLAEVLPPPAGIYLPDALLTGLYVGDNPVVQAWRGDTEIVVP